MAFFGSIFSVAASAQYDIKIACYYANSQYVYLADASNKILTYKAYFNNSSYSLVRGTIVGTQNACQKMLGEAKTLTKVMAVNATTSSLSGDYLGSHYNLGDVKTDALIAKYKARLGKIDAFKDFSISISFTEDQDSRNFLRQIENIIDPSADEKEYVNHNMIVDLPRSDTDIFDEQNRIYHQRIGMIEIRNRSLNQVTQNSYSVEPFKLIAQLALEKNPSLNILSLRKGIAKALFTRMQGFWAPALLKVSSYIFKDPDDIAEVQVKAGRSLNNLKLKGQRLEIESTQTLFVKILTEDGALEPPIGQIKVIRNSAIDLSVGEFFSTDGKNEKFLLIFTE